MFSLHVPDTRMVMPRVLPVCARCASIALIEPPFLQSTLLGGAAKADAAKQSTTTVLRIVQSVCFTFILPSPSLRGFTAFWVAHLRHSAYGFLFLPGCARKPREGELSVSKWLPTICPAELTKDDRVRGFADFHLWWKIRCRRLTPYGTKLTHCSGCSTPGHAGSFPAKNWA